MEPRPEIELLESVHPFPGTYQIKAIGASEDDFVGRVLSAAREEVAAESDVDYSLRTMRGGRHVGVTLNIAVQTPEQVLALYARIREVHGLAYLF
jgi:putative lipoic acid-binding regulatory protein